MTNTLHNPNIENRDISTLNFSNLIVGEDYSSDEVIVKLKYSVEPTNLLNQLDVSGNVTVRERTQTLGIELWELDGISVEDAIAIYSQNPNIEYIEPNYRISVEQIPNDPHFNLLWGLQNTGQSGGTPDADIDAPEAWNIQTGSGNVTIGVIDTGVDYTHTDLVDNIWTNSGETPNNGIDDDNNGYVDDFYGWDFAYNDNDPMDVYGHGTHVAGTIAAEGSNSDGVVGVNWDAQIMPIKFLNDNGYGYTFDAIQSVEYATLMGANLTNNSWGGGGYSQGLYDAIESAGEAGQLFIAAAGNDYGNNNDIYPHYPSSYDLDNIIAVASTDRYDNLSSFSNYGPTSVDLGAPGSSIYSTIPGNKYGYKSGTSMATPHVSGVAALVWAEYPELTAEEVRSLILSTVDPIFSLEGKTVTGGRVNAYGALIGPQPGEIYGSLWNDLNGNSRHDVGEPELPNWTVYLDQNGNGQLDSNETSTKTDINGNYGFTDLTPGSYSVAEVIQPGWQQTYPGFNGGFETGNFPSWQTLGYTTIETASFGSGPTEGTYQALLTNSVGSVSDTQIENFLGLTSGSLDSLGNGNATEGSVIKQTFAVEEGAEVSFEWNFLTNEATPTYYNDFAFITISSLDTLANTYNSFKLSSTPFYEETGFGTFSYTFPTSGTFTIGIGLVDVGDTVVDSGLLVDNFMVMGNFRPTGAIQNVNLGSGQIVNDVNFGNQANIINGSNQKDTLIGTLKNEILNGENGKDELYGMEGNDVLDGGNAQDILVGVNPDAVNPGLAEIDIFNGGNGPDTFVLGDVDDVYYDDGSPNTEGLSDYALIVDLAEPDQIQLNGTAGDYRLIENYTIGSSTGTGIFLKDTVNEMIGLVEGVTGLALNSNDFSFV